MSSKMWSSNSSSQSRKSSECKKKRKSSDGSGSCDTEKEEKPMSPWYWSNYYKALMWQNKHKVAVWKSYAAALEYERMYLLKELSRLGGNCAAFMPPNEIQVLLKNKPETQEHEDENENENENEIENCEDGEIEFEMSEEMIKFFTESIKNKLEKKKLKEKEVKQLELDGKELKDAHELREKEMKLLYGEGSCMIIGMETAVQLSFEKYCNMKSPNYWPNIPLKL